MHICSLYEGSYLSDGVHHMICGLNEEYKNKLQAKDVHRDEPLDVLEDFMTENLQTFSVVENTDRSIDYYASVKRILPICHTIHKQLIQTTNENFNEKFGMDLDWTGSRKRILECLLMLKSQSDSDIILCFLLLISILECSLGNVYISLSASKQCPTNLKDLLVAKEIQDLIGNDVAKAAYVIAGPPQGINLRNVLWHGFISGNEIPPQYGSFLVMFIVYVGRKCSGIDIKRRQMITFTELDDLLGVFPLIDCHAHISGVSELFSDTVFISQRMLPIWKRVLFYYQEQKYDYALVLLMPQLESSLRQVFALVNGCPDRVLTAESTTLYTTFDEMLAPSIAEGHENQLRTHIGDDILDMLIDVLMHSEGPRIRDHLSHGEVDLDMVPKELCSHLICICVVISLYFHQNPSVLCNRRQVSNDLNPVVKTFEEVLPCKANKLSSAKIKRGTMVESNTEFEKFKPNCENYPHHAVVVSTSNSASTTPIENAFKELSILNPNHVIEDSCHHEDTLSTRAIKRQRESFVEQLITISSNYQSVYHPCQILKREICSASKLFEAPVSTPCDLGMKNDSSSVKNVEMLERTWLYLYSTNKALLSEFPADLSARLFSKEIHKLCSKIHLQTLYRPRRELEVICLLRSTVQHYGSTLTQVFKMANQRYQQWETKQLRSRQRANYQRLLSLLPFYCNTLKLSLLLVIIELASLQVNSLHAGYMKFFKRLLQFSENLESLSSCNKNRWDECQAVCEQLLELIQKHCTMT